MRQVVLDTETTGLEVGKGHRIIEIGCIELTERRLTGREFHRYVNPEREIDPGAQAVHGISNEFLADKPRFAQIVDELLAFLDGAELVIHNAAFDIAFLNAELQHAGESYGCIADRSSVLDTLGMAREKYPGQKNSLDALCKRLSVDNSRRNQHGALLDAQLLAEVYLAMTAGQGELGLGAESVVVGRTTSTSKSEARPPLQILRANDEEINAHESRLQAIAAAAKGRCVWRLETNVSFDT